MTRKFDNLTIIILLLILPTMLFAASPVYLPFEITASSSSSEATKFSDAVVESDDAHWGWVEEYWSKGNGIGSKYGGSKLTRTHYDGIVLGPKKTTASSSGTLIKTYSQSGSEGITHSSAYNWDKKYIIIESREVIKNVRMQADVYSDAATASNYYWSIYMTNNKSSWGDPLWDSGNNAFRSDYTVDETIDLSGKPNYDPSQSRYLVVCYSGNFSAYISYLQINENTYMNVVEDALPDEYSAYIGEYQSQDIVVDFCNLDGINNADISEFTVTSSNPVFSCIGQSGDALGLLKTGERNISIRFNPTDPTPQTYYATITIKGGTSGSSLSKTVNVVGHSYRQQKLIWDQKFSRLDISDADIPLTAYSSVGLTPVNYSSADPSVVTVVDGVLHIVGKGRTMLTATQPGNSTYASVSISKYVYVSEPGDPCEAYDLYEPGHVILHTIDEQVYELFGLPADKLTFDACRTLDAITTSALGVKYFRVAESYDNGKTWHELARFDDMPRSETTYIIWGDNWKNYTVQLSENATHVKIYTVTGATMRHHIRNVIVTQKPYIRPQTSPIAISPEMGSISYSTTLRVAYSALLGDLEVALKTPTDLFTIDHTEIPIPCGDVDTANVVLTMHNVPCVSEVRNALILSNGDLRVEVPIIATPQKSVQIINWTTIPTGVTTSSLLTVSDMGAMVAPRAILPDYTSDNPEIADFDAYGNLVIKQTGDVTIRASQPGNECFEPAEDITKTISIAQDYLTFDDYDADKDWFNANNWKPNRNVIPNHLAFATLEANVEIDGTAMALSKRLTLDGHFVTIKPNGNLHAETIIGADDSTLFILEGGDATNAPGALATKTADVIANVQIFVEASNLSNEPGYQPTWQYFGVPYRTKAGLDFYYAWVCEWSEKEGQWSYKNVESILTPWTGYCITQPHAETHTYSLLPNKIQTGNHTFDLSYSKKGEYRGYNIVTNSYTAPIDITKLEASDFVGVEKTIYLYNTGSYADVSLISKESLAGQYLAIPALEADYSPYDITIIPPMQAFCLQATAENATLTIDYDRTVWGTTAASKPKRSPRRNMPTYNDDQNLIIDIKGSRYADAISVLTRSNCTGDYDDGHDAYKLEGNRLAPQLYSTEADDKIYTVDARETLEGHYIGLKPGEDNYYTLTFRLVETDEFYYLKDLTDNTYYPIIEGMSINIAAEKTMSRRFKIVSEIEYDESDGSHGVATDICMNSANAFLTNSSDEVVIANIYDMSGRLVERQTVAPHSTLTYQIDQLPHGTYIINMGNQNLKVVR